MSRVEVVLWVMAAAFLALAFVWRNGTYLGNDSYQYLSETSSILSGQGLTTSIIHFDVERKHGTLPAPLTTFPPGFPITVSVVAVTGLPSEVAATLVSLLSYLITIVLLAEGLRRFGVSASVARFILVLLLVNSFAVRFSGSVTTESMFTALSTGAVLLFAMHRDEDTVWQLVLANILVGLACWTRYAGLFLFLVTGLYYGGQFVVKRTRSTFAAALCVLVSAALVAGLLGRNWLIAGTWKGGNEKLVSNPVLPVLKHYAIAMYHLVFGGMLPTRLEVISAFAFITGLLLAASSLALVLHGEGNFKEWRSRYLILLFPLSYVGIYTLAMIYMGISSVISFGERMFYPIVPVLLLLLGVVVDEIVRAAPRKQLVGKTLRTSGVLFALSVAAMNGRDLLVEDKPAPHTIVARSLGEYVTPDQTMFQWLQSSVPTSQPVVASNGQATAFVLQRPAISLVGSHFGGMPWNEATIMDVMRRYGAELLILYPHAPSELAGAQEESGYLKALLGGQAGGSLVPVAETEHVKVFRWSRGGPVGGT